MTDLHDHSAATFMNSIGYDAPSGDLLVGIDSRSNRIAVSECADCRAFGDDESSGRPLGIILSIQFGWHVLRASAHPRKRRHDDSIRNLDGSQVESSEEGIRGHDKPFVLIWICEQGRRAVSFTLSQNRQEPVDPG